MRINAFAAGPHTTAIFDSFGDAKESVLKDLAWRTALGRPGTAKEGGEMIAFMLSSRASNMTGEVLVSDGGSVNINVFSDQLYPEESFLKPSDLHAKLSEKNAKQPAPKF